MEENEKNLEDIRAQKTVNFTQENVKYKITTIINDQRLDIAVNDTTRSDHPIFENNYSLTELKAETNNNIFKITNRIEEAKYLIDTAVEKKKIKIDQKEDSLDIVFETSYFISEDPFKLKLPKREELCPVEDSKIEQLEDDRAQLNKAHDDLKKEIFDSKFEVKETIKRNERSKQKKSEIEKQNDKLKEKNEELKKKIQKLKEDNENIKKRIDGLKEKKKELQEKIDQEIKVPKDTELQEKLYEDKKGPKKTVLREEINIFKENVLNSECSSIISQTISDIDGTIIKTNDELSMINRKIGKVIGKVKLELIYKATEDGDSCEDFHQRCDYVKGKGTVVVIETLKNERFGGYTSQSWQGNDVSKKDPHAFLFSLNDGIRFNIPKDKDAITCDRNSGPIFSDGIIKIPDCFFSFGGSTSPGFPGIEDYELSGGDKNFKIKEMEVYRVISL